MPSTDWLDTDELLFLPVVAHHLDDRFIRRDWLLSEVKQLLENPQYRFILIEGVPGAGKTSFLAWLTRELVLAPRYFIRRDSIVPHAQSDAHSLLLRTGHQLAVLRPSLMTSNLGLQTNQEISTIGSGGQVIGMEIGRLHLSPFHDTALQVHQHVSTVDGTLIGIRINTLTADHRAPANLPNLMEQALIDPARRLEMEGKSTEIILLLDALDEIDTATGWTSGQNSIIDWLTDCADLPSNVRVVATTRPSVDLLDRFFIRKRNQIKLFEINNHADRVNDDIMEYTKRIFATLPPQLQARDDLVRSVTRQADGVFLYAALWGESLRAAIEIGDDTTTDALLNSQNLPSGLEHLYRYLIGVARHRVTLRYPSGWQAEWQSYHHILLSVLAVAYVPLTRIQLILFSALFAAEQVRVMDAVADIGQFLKSDRQGIRLCHASFAEFLTSTPGYYWYVNPSANHLAIGRQLIAQYGSDWSECTDQYALTYTARHVITALEAGGDEAPVIADLIVGLLGGDEYGLAKAINPTVGFGSLVADHIAAWHAIAVISPQRRAEMVAGLASVVARLAERTDVDPIDLIQSTLAYRIDGKDLYSAVLALLNSEDFLLQRVTDTERQAVLALGLAHSEAGRLRRLGGGENLERARSLLNRIVETARPYWDKIEPHQRDFAKRLSGVFYDVAYLEYLHGNPDAAVEWFGRSIQMARQAGNRVGEYMTEAMLHYLEFITGRMSAHDYGIYINEALEYFGSPNNPSPHAERWVMSLHVWLLDVACATGNEQLIRQELTLLEENDWLRGHTRPDSHRPDDMLTTYRARAFLATGHYAESTTMYEECLGGDLTGSLNPREELARDLYDYARALIGSGRVSEARQVLELATSCPDYMADWIWKPRIHELLDRLGTDPV
ncbi:hypothetical protein [Nonomuraea endophytica]|uniref:hypothetical protein n=1 Tax=Nonomuraea endophytica TaxID=714136 RepID=UPI0037C9F9F3